MASGTFPLYGLPPEIRSMVWEQTWPEGRVVEALLCDSQDWEAQSGDEPTEYLALQLSSRISTFFDHDFDSRVIEDCRIEKCSDPVALQICRESRALTLRHYFRMTHSKLGRSFYFNPNRDVFWLSTDITDHPDDLKRLKGHYAECWTRIESVLVSWEQYSTQRYPQYALPHVTGLRVVQVLLSEQDDEVDQLEAENQGEAVIVDQNITEKGDGTADDDSDMEIAKEMTERDSAMARGVSWTVQYMDQKRNVFCQWSKARGAVKGSCV